MKRSTVIFKRITCVLGILFIVLGVIPIPQVSVIGEASASSISVADGASLPRFTSVSLFDALNEDEAPLEGEGDAGEDGGDSGGDEAPPDDAGEAEGEDTGAGEEPEETPPAEPEVEPEGEPEGETAEEECVPSEDNDCAAEEAAPEEEEVVDLCPDDSNKTDPGECGCGVVDEDLDGNGVMDCLEGEEDEEAAALKEIINVMAEADAVLVDANNEPIPLASNEAGEVLASADPYFTRGGTKYCFEASGTCDGSCNFCNNFPGTSGIPTSTPIQDAINNVEFFGNPDDDTIYVLPGLSAYFENLVIHADDLTLMGDPGDPTEPGVGANAPVLSGDGIAATQDVGIKIFGDGVSIIGFVIENYYVAIQLQPSGSADFTASNNKLKDNYVAVQNYNSIPGVILNYNDFENNTLAIYNEEGWGGTQYLDARYNYWGCEDGPVVAVKLWERVCSGGCGGCCHWDWVTHYYQWQPHNPSSATELFGYDPSQAGCECLYGGKLQHWDHTKATFWTPYKIILDPIETSSEPVCGDGSLDDGEECDDGNRNDNDGCSSTCQVEFCGDGVIQTSEVCDGQVGVGPGETCSPNCDVIYFCGDGVVNQTGEQCDGADGVGPGQTCSAGCLLLTCGDGVVNQGWEECDGTDGVGLGESCSPDCELLTCGDGFVNQAWEECDGTSGVGPGQSCTVDCELLYCGDGVVNQGWEVCDGAAGVGAGETCSADCTQVYSCGDGVVNQASEQCDGTAGVGAGETCSATCQILYCGDGVLNQGWEECDGTDGTTPGVTFCTAECTLDNVPPDCGDGIVQVGEECDGSVPPGAPDGAVCNPTTCQLEWCGDGIVQEALNEECDGTAGVGPDETCSATCELLTCGDGILNQAWEECDGTAGVGAGETCSETCELLICGDGILNQEWEECDGTEGVAEGETCSDTCELLFCGDGEINQEWEECDGDDGVEEDETCSQECVILYCGDGVINQTWEVCDGEDWCTAECAYKEFASLLLDPYCINTTTLQWTIENPNSFPVPDVHAVLDGIPSIDGIVMPGTTIVGNTGDGPASHTLSVTWPGGSASDSSREDCAPTTPPPPGTPIAVLPIPVTGAGGPVEELLIIPVTGVDFGMELAGLQKAFLYMGLMLFGITMVLEGMTKRIKF